MRSVIFAVSTALTVLLSACTGAASSVPVNTVSSVSASTSIPTSSEADFINHFAVDIARIYAAGYSAGGETMSRAVAMRPDLYAAYLHGASQWDGGFAPIAENGVAVYIYMAQGDEYYGVQKAQDAYNGLHDAYAAAGWTDEQIDTVLQMQTPDNAFFDAQGLHVYHAAANVVFDDADILNWIVSKHK